MYFSRNDCKIYSMETVTKINNVFDQTMLKLMNNIERTDISLHDILVEEFWISQKELIIQVH